MQVSSKEKAEARAARDAMLEQSRAATQASLHASTDALRLELATSEGSMNNSNGQAANGTASAVHTSATSALDTASHSNSAICAWVPDAA